MGDDGLTYSEAVRIAAAEAGAALGMLREAVQTGPGAGASTESVRQRAPRAHRRRGKASALVDADAQNGKPVPREWPSAPPADAQMTKTLDALVSDFRSLLANAEERLPDDRTRCDRLIAEALSANARADRLEGELTALRSSMPTLETCISDLRSRLANAEERSSDERSRCDLATAEAASANVRATKLEHELVALRSYRPWWRRFMYRRSPARPE